MRNKAQSTLEYAVFIGIVAAALVTMQVYMKRGIQGGLRGYAQKLTPTAEYTYDKVRVLPDIMLDKATNIVEEKDVIDKTKLGGGFAYSPRATTSNSTITTHSEETAKSEGKIITGTATQSRDISRQENLLPLAAEPTR